MAISYLRRGISLWLSLAIALSPFFGVSIVGADSSNDSVLGKAAYHPIGGNLPGGTSIEVAINTPADGAVVGNGNITVDGTASIGMGAAVPNTALVYVLDVSGSTASLDGCGGDQNFDAIANTVLDCEIAAARNLNNIAEGTGTIGDVGIGVFGLGGAAADVGPASGDQKITGPDTDANINNVRDVVDVLFSVVIGRVNRFTVKNVGGGDTVFAEGIKAALDILSASSRPNKMVVFMSDGENNAFFGDPVSTLLVPGLGVKFFTFAVGDLANCTTPNANGNLQDIANLTGGTCAPVSSTNIDLLPSILPVVVASQLISLEQSVDALPFTPISNTEIDPDLPLNGPASVTYSYSLSGLTPGEHEICVQATGSDGGGEGSVKDCHKVTVAAVDLSITKTDSPDPVTAGGNLTYTLTATNNGPSDATGVKVTDTLPAGVTFVPATSSPGCAVAGNIVTCDLGDLANGASATVTIDVTVDSTSACASILTNTAEVSSNEPDSDSTNNTAITDTAVSCLCNILDDFNRPNGQLGSNWDGRTNGYRIVNNEVAVRSGGPIYWQQEAYGADQEACVTLTRINPKSKQHALLLKVQELNDWHQGAILVSYNARSGNVEVKARDVSNHKWILVGELAPSTPIVDGDQLRAQALADGTVEVLINNTSIGTADAGSFYANKGGQIGLWFRGAGGDDDKDDDDDKDNDDHDDHDRIVLAREKDSDGDKDDNGEHDDDGDDDDGSSAARRALLDDFGGGTITQAALPDLSVTLINPPTQITCPGGGGTCVLTVEFMITNTSSVVVTSSFEVLIEAEEVPSKTITISGLAAGASQSLSEMLGPGNNCYNPNCLVRVTVDSTNAIPESDQTNNVAEREDMG